MFFSEQQIESLSPNPAAFNAGKSLSAGKKWETLCQNERAIWGEFQGSGKDPYRVQIDTNSLVYKCNCPSRQFPCKHTIGLMLLYAKTPDEFRRTKDEPDWVKTWFEKRLAKANKPEAEVERTPEEQEKLEKAREKTQTDRFENVQAGVAELDLWLKDLIRIGIMELPNKPLSEFEKVAARMVDAKAPGLAGWVKSLSRLNFEDQTEWQSEALGIISKLFLLIRTFQNFDNLSPLWQTSIKNLVGWNQSSKELLANPEAETVKDKWLVAGQIVETVDDITTQRNWLIGTNTNRKALILNFATKFSAIENPLLPGSIINAELAYFPSVQPYRAAIKMQRGIENTLEKLPESFSNWNEVYTFKAGQLQVNPWMSDICVAINEVRMTKQDNRWIICDDHQNFIPVVLKFDLEKVLKWLVVSGNRPQHAVCIVQNGKVMPLGVFQDNQYILL